MSTLFGELRRRKVFRVAAAYMVLGWVLIQVADTIAPMMNLPETAPRFVLFLLIVLFPVAIFLAWAFEVRPTDGESASGGTAGRSVVAVTATVAMVGVVAWYFFWGRPELSEPAAATPDIMEAGQTMARTSIAVLPFLDLSAEGDQEYFGDGIAEELLNVLASIKELAVASRTSAFAFKGANRNIGEISSILNVSYVLEGSVRKASDRLLITAQLIDTATDRHIWSDTFERELTTDNIFSIQNEIATAIVGALNTELDLGVDTGVDVPVTTENLDAYDLYLQAKQLANISSVDNAKRVVDLLEQAVELDPDFAAAGGLLAGWTTNLPSWDQSLDGEPYHRRAIEIARHALILDPTNADVHWALGAAYFSLHEWEPYEAAVKEAARHIPGRLQNPDELMGLGYLERAYEHAMKFSAASPDNNFYYLLQGLYFNQTRQFEKAIPRFQDAILKGYNGGAERYLAMAYLSLGDSAVMSATLALEYEARDPELLILLPHFIDLVKASPDEFLHSASRFRIVARELGFDEASLLRPGPRFDIRAPMQVAMAYGRFDVITDTFWGNMPMFWMWEPNLQPWRRSESFRERVRESGMLAYWRKYGWPDLCRPVGEENFECD